MPVSNQYFEGGYSEIYIEMHYYSNGYTHFKIMNRFYVNLLLLLK